MTPKPFVALASLVVLSALRLGSLSATQKQNSRSATSSVRLRQAPSRPFSRRLPRWTRASSSRRSHYLKVYCSRLRCSRRRCGAGSIPGRVRAVGCRTDLQQTRAEDRALGPLIGRID